MMGPQLSLVLCAFFSIFVAADKAFARPSLDADGNPAWQEWQSKYLEPSPSWQAWSAEPSSWGTWSARASSRSRFRSQCSPVTPTTQPTPQPWSSFSQPGHNTTARTWSSWTQTRSGSWNSTSYTSSSSRTTTATSTASSCPGPSSYWLADIAHQGIAPYQSNPNYKIFRNVKDFGAVGDGITDDTAAINAAISAPGDRCAPGSCNSTTTTPAVVYFPPGQYLISSSIIQYYYTSLIGNPNCLPTIKASANFNSSFSFMIDGDPYNAQGQLSYGATNVFWRQNRNFIIDMTLLPANSSLTGVHWPTGQATSLTNMIFEMSTAPNTLQRGLLVESGSGGFMSDLVFNGGHSAADLANQQFTFRNFTFNGCQTALNMLFDWSWSFQQMNFNNVSTAINMTSGGTTAQNVGGVVVFDSVFKDVNVGVVHSNTGASNPPSAGNIILENVEFQNTKVAVQGPTQVNLHGGTFQVPAWGLGHSWTATSTTYTFLNGYIPPNQRPDSLLGADGRYYTRTKPQYADRPVSDFLSVRSAGAVGDGSTDDTQALQRAINTAVAQNKILFIDGGDYLVTSTIHIPAGAKIVGEPYPVILAAGDFFGNIKSPQPVIQVGNPGDTGVVEWTDTILSTRGYAPGAIMIQWNLASPGPDSSGTGPSGIWDVHTRIGGFTGSNLQYSDCPADATKAVAIPPAPVDQSCIAAALDLHITSSARNLYMENNWLWVADHDADDSQLRQITVYAGRGALIEANFGIWLVGTAIEHHTLYEYTYSSTQDIFAGFVQTETAYYQPNPPAQIPFPQLPAYSDPTFPAHCLNGSAYIDPNSILQPNSIHNDCDGWAYRILDSSSILTYGAGFYSFFYNYNVTCSNQGNGEECQSHNVDIENSPNNVGIYGMNTVGVQYMITVDGKDIVPAADNNAGFTDGFALFRVQ